jgi:phenylalanine-4-hydroxylase
MKQEYEKYTPIDHDTWNKLFTRQVANIQDKASTEYLESLEKINPVLNGGAIPRFDDLSAFLLKETGWTIEVVPGLIPVEDFFALLAQKKFCSSTWIRKPHQLDYLEEPDMFHDIFGHTPLLVHPIFSAFMERFGQVGHSLRHEPELIIALQRLYWFTIEFGLQGTADEPRIYGAGILSSFGETNHVWERTKNPLEFDLGSIFTHLFRTDVIQEDYYLLPSFEELFESFESWSASKNLISKKRA